MKRILILLITTTTFISCSDEAQTEKEIALKSAKQEIDRKHGTMTTEYEVDSFVKLSDNSYLVREKFDNPLVGKKIRVSEEYFYSESFDSVIERKPIKSEMISEGEWINMRF